MPRRRRPGAEAPKRAGRRGGPAGAREPPLGVSRIEDCSQPGAPRGFFEIVAGQPRSVQWNVELEVIQAEKDVWGTRLCPGGLVFVLFQPTSPRRRAS
jgi:hypothetical protein